MAGLADLSAYDVSMGVEAAAFDIPTAEAMPLCRRLGRVRIARGVLTAENVAGSVDRSSLRDGRLVLVLAPTVALSSLSAALDFDLAENHSVSDACWAVPRWRRDEPRQSIAGRAKGTLTLRQDGAVLRQSYDVTALNATLRYAGMPLPVAVDSGGVHYETGGALVLRKLAGSIGASRFEALDAQVAFGPGPVVRSASGAATLVLDELYRWIATLPAGEALRRELGALHGSVGVKLARLAGPLAAPGRLEVDAVLTPHAVHATSPRLPNALAVDGGSIRVRTRISSAKRFAIIADFPIDVVDVTAPAAPALVGQIAEQAHTLFTETRANKTLAYLGNYDGTCPVYDVTDPTAPIKLESTRVRWPAPAPWRFDVAGTASFPGGARSEFDLSYRPGSIAIGASRSGSGQRRARRRLGAGRADSPFTASCRDSRWRESSRRRGPSARCARLRTTVDMTAALRRATGKLEAPGSI